MIFTVKKKGNVGLIFTVKKKGDVGLVFTVKKKGARREVCVLTGFTVKKRRDERFWLALKEGVVLVLL